MARSSVADIFAQTMAHDVDGRREHNVVSLVVRTTVGANPNFGVEGTLVTETLLCLRPEPHINGIDERAVKASGGALWFSDQRMTVALDSLTEDQASDPAIRFDINGQRFKVLDHKPGPIAWMFVIRRETEAQVAP